MAGSDSLIKINLDGKPLEKLIEVVSNGIGTLYRPRKIRKEAEANAYAIKVTEKAVAEAAAEKQLIEVETQERIAQRIVAQEIRRQNNIDSVVESAAEDLKGKQVSDEPVNEDWSTRFFGIIQDVSREEMKKIFSKILAKEIERPSTFSMRTLETLRNLSAEEAELFEKVSSFVLFQRDHFIYNEPEVLDKLGLTYPDIALLTEAGLLQSGDFITKNYKANPAQDNISAIVYGKYVVLLKLPKGSTVINVPVLLLTQSGRELLQLIDEPKFNLDYLQEFANNIKKNNTEATVQYAELIEIVGNKVSYKQPVVTL